MIPTGRIIEAGEAERQDSAPAHAGLNPNADARRSRDIVRPRPLCSHT